MAITPDQQATLQLLLVRGQSYADLAKNFATWSAALSEKRFYQKGLFLTGWYLSGTLRTDLHDADRR